MHSAAAGVASMLFPEMLATQIVITNSAGVHAMPIAEQSLAGILALLRGVDLARELQRAAALVARAVPGRRTVRCATSAGCAR